MKYFKETLSYLIVETMLIGGACLWLAQWCELYGQELSCTMGLHSNVTIARTISRLRNCTSFQIRAGKKSRFAQPVSNIGKIAWWNMPEKINYYVTEHFKYSDFLCPCCDSLKITPGFYRHVELLEKLRVTAGFPISVVSGYRCRTQNRTFAGGARSWHLLFATDISPGDGSTEKLATLLTLADELGFGGIGLYETYIHLDLRPETMRWRG